MLTDVRTSSTTRKTRMKKTRRSTDARTKQPVVSADQEELIRRRHHQDLLELAGRIRLDIDLKRSRRR